MVYPRHIFVSVPSQDLDFQRHMSRSFLCKITPICWQLMCLNYELHWVYFCFVLCIFEIVCNSLRVSTFKKSDLTHTQTGFTELGIALFLAFICAKTRDFKMQPKIVTHKFEQLLCWYCVNVGFDIKYVHFRCGLIKCKYWSIL